MDGLLLSPSPEPQNPITDLANTMTNLGHLGEEFKDETTKKKIKPLALENRKLKAKKKDILNNDEASTSNPNSTRRVSHRLGKRTVRLGMARRSVVERQAEALALGMSVATFASLVFEKKSATSQNTNVADLALIYASAVKECLANVYGHKLGSFAERSFNSGLGIFQVINGSDQLDTLEKSKLKMGVSRATIRAERFKTELEDKIKSCLATICTNWLVLSVIHTLFYASYGAYVSSQQRIMDNPMCKAIEEQRYPWMVGKEASFFIWICRHQVWVQMYFPVLMILVVTYLIIHRSSRTKQRMSVTSYLLFLGIVCGLSGKLCVDTLGSDGKLWLFVWAMLCLLQYGAVRFITWALFGLLTQESKPNTMVLYWGRPSILFGLITMVLYWGRPSILFGLILALPLINGLLS